MSGGGTKAGGKGYLENFLFRQALPKRNAGVGLLLPWKESKSSSRFPKASP